ncbi:MAG: glycine cleavage system protein GcvH [Verrucomicrobiales bacterium]|nr:glycine cleavage system protein GcvH [Verrucomicrobiales bacterium]
MNVPENLRFMPSHEWVDASDPESYKIGISDHAQAELTDIVYLELPEVGRTVAKGDPVAVIESVKAANDIYAPVSGEIIAVNEPLGEAPEPVNEDPFGEGWIFSIKPSDPAELQELMDASSYREHIS